MRENPRFPAPGDEKTSRKGIMALHVARCGRKGRHVVAYRVGAPAKPPVIDVLRVLHDAMDLSRHTGETEDEDSNHA